MPLCSIKKCDILILSADFGTGHHQVSMSIKEIANERQPSWEVGIYNFFHCIYPLINKSIKFGYSQMIRRFSYGYDWFYRVTKDVEPDSKWQRILNKMGRSKLLELIKKCSPRVIVCTFPTPAGVVSQLKAEGEIDIPLAVVITDVADHSQWIHPEVDAYIVAADIVGSRLLARGIAKEKIHVTGIPIRSQFEAPVSDPGIWIKLNLDPNIFTLLIMGGGQGLMPGIEGICTRLAELSLPMQIIALTGSNQNLAKKLKPIAQTSSIPIRILGYIENIAPLMKGTDLLLSKAGGITVFEALAVKLPILLYRPLPGHEMCNVDFLLDNRAALLAKDEALAVELIKESIEDPSILDDISEAMEPLAKPFSARDSVNVILKLASGGIEDKEFAESSYREDINMYA
ncbi:MAG: hypothetical protein GX375_03700 [Clostridiales bacterium]|nr:hypothetical protein [Clostridiales bacterium]